MTMPSIPDRAATLVCMRAGIEKQIETVREAGGDWTLLKITSDDVMRGAAEALDHAWSLLSRVGQFAAAEIESRESNE